MADVAGYAEKHRKKIARKTKVTIALVLVLLAAIIAGAAYGLNYWVSTAAFLGVNDNKVAIYRGVPGDLFGISFSTLEETTDIDVDDLQPGLANRLRDGQITADNLDAAKSLVAEYEQEVSTKKAAEEQKAEAAKEKQDEKAAQDAASGASTSKGSSASATGNESSSSSASGQKSAKTSGGDAE